jgi:hypothetical protein
MLSERVMRGCSGLAEPMVGGITFLMGEGVSNCQEASPLIAQGSKVEAEIAGFDRSRPNDMFVCGFTVEGINARNGIGGMKIFSM